MNTETDINENVLKTSRSKAILFVSIIVLLLIALVISVVFLYADFKARSVVDKTRAFESIGGYKKSLEYYAVYLKENPDDLEAKYAYANALKEDNNIAQHIEVLEIVYSEAVDKSNDQLAEDSRISLQSAYMINAQDFREKAERALKEKDYESARDNYMKERLSIVQKAKYTKAVPKYSMEFDDYKKEWLNPVCRPYFETIANHAMTFWYEGKNVEADEAISQIPIESITFDCDEYNEYRYAIYAKKMKSAANDALDKEDFKAIAEYLEEALDKILKCETDELRENIPVLRFQIAVAYASNENYQQARDEFSKLQKDFPEYEADVVAELIDDCREGELVLTASNYEEKATKQFNDEDYANARINFRSAIESFKKSGMKDNDSELAGLRYNIAITYWNEKNWPKAREWLQICKKHHPDFEKDDVRDLLQKATNYSNP